MKMDCETLKQYLSSFSLVKQCDVVRDGSLRIATPFQYPNGGLIDVFLRNEDNLWQDLTLSDQGQTTAYLLDLQVKLWTTQRRKNLVIDICKTLEVNHSGGILSVEFPSTDIPRLADHLVRLAQACIRVTDIAFTHRFRTQGVFQEDVEEFISSTQLPYRTGVVVDGKFGKPVEFDFEVTGKRVKSLVQTISTSSVTAHNISNEIFRKWYDIHHSPDFQRITVYDSSRDIFRTDDLDRLSELSTVVAFPDESDRLNEIIAA